MPTSQIIKEEQRILLIFLEINLEVCFKVSL